MASSFIQDLKRPLSDQRARRQHQDRYRTLVEVSPQAVWSARPDGYVTYCNRWWLDYTGLAMKELQGNGWAQTVHPDHRQRILDIWLQAAASGGDYELEIPFRRASDGMYRWHLAKALPIRDGKARIKEWVGIAIDIHDRKQAEQTAARTEAHLRLLLDSTPQKIFTASPDGKVDYFNPQWSEFTGLPFEIIRDWGWTQFIHPDDVEMNVKRWQASIDTGQPFSFEHRFRRADGAYRWHLSRAVPVRNGAGQIIMWVGANTDIDDQKRAESAVRESEQRVRLIVDSSLDAVVTMSEQGSITGWNPQAEAVFGWTREEAMGRKLADLIIPKEYREAHRRGLEHFLRTGTGPALNNRLSVAALHKDGREFPIELTISPLKLGGKFEFSAFVRDVTEHKRWQEEVETLNETLEQRVAERTAQLETVNRELEAFSYSVSHDLRAPLRAIDGFSRGLLHDYADCLDERGKADLDRVRAAAQRMGQLIDDLLTLSRFTRSEMRMARVDLSDMARAVAAECQASEPTRAVEVVIAPDLTATADAQLTRVVLDNLIGNAWKFTGHQPRARIEIGAELHDGGTAFYVRDNGCGFDMSYADKLFGAFQRLHSRAEFDGSGIGLATVQRIVHRHGGRIWARAAVDQGATFYFALSPADEAQAWHA
ncbi:MAG: PAS domain-containing sensor histidine kinase [Gammaproteobacteria bacterium]